MAAGQLMPPANATSNPNALPSSNAQKRYSFLDQLDNLALVSPELTFTPHVSRSRRVDDETIRRLSASLQNLLSQKHGDNHLPELPIPTYDNGNVDVVAVHNSSRTSPASSLEIPPEAIDVSHRPQSSTSTVVPSRTIPRFRPPLPQNSAPRKVSEIPCELDELQPTRSVPQTARPRASVDPTRVSCYGANGREIRPSRPGPSRPSRPVSMCNAADAGGAKNLRTESVASQLDRVSRHKKTTSCNEQRFQPIALLESSKVQPRRRFRLMPSFKDLNVHAKALNKRSIVPESVAVPDSPDSTSSSSQLISLNDALRGGVMPLTPLHDPTQDQKFTLECKDMLQLKPDSHCRGSKKRLVPRLGSVPQDLESVVDRDCGPSVRHGSSASEAMTVGTSIFDLDWPQPNTYTTISPEVYQRQRAAIVSRRSVPTIPVHDQNVMVPSPPPTYPLPPLPDQKMGNIRKQLSRKRSPTQKSVDTNITLASLNQTIATSGASTGRRPNRIAALAASKGLQVDAQLNADGSSTYEQHNIPSPVPSPLNARLVQSKRNSRVHELKKKHLSMLVKDTIPIEATGPKSQVLVSTNSHSSDISTSVYSPDRALSRRKLLSVDKRKQPQLIPEPARYPEGNQDPAGGTKANIGKSRNAKATSSTSIRRSQVSDLVFSRPLAHSGVMVVVDSSPKRSCDFRAGAIKITTPPRRKTSIDKNQISSPIPYQPGLRKSSLPITSGALAVNSSQISTSSTTMRTTPRRISAGSAPVRLAPRLASGMQSPSKASSILEPATVQIPPRCRGIGQYTVSAERPRTPVRQSRNKVGTPRKDQIFKTGSPVFKQSRPSRTSPDLRQIELAQLHAEIDRMVRVRQDSRVRRELLSKPKLSFADRFENERIPQSKIRPLFAKPPQASLVPSEPVGMLAGLPIGKKHLQVYEESELSITPRSSFRSTSSGSTGRYQRKNSDASLTDPTDCDENPLKIKSSGRLFIVPSPTPPEAEEKLVTASLTTSKKDYGTISTYLRKRKTADVTTPWLDSVTDHRLVTLPRKASVATQKASIRSKSGEGIELNHFLTEADEMDDAIDSFLQAQTGAQPVQLAPGTQMRSLLSQDNRRSAVSGIVDLQRIQNQVNGSKEFGRISLITRPRTT